MNMNDAINLIRSLSGQANMLTVPVMFVDLTGDIESAILLSQILYWTGKTNNKDGWIYKSNKEWQEEIHLATYSIRKATKKLTDMGIVETKLKRANGSPTLHYRINSEEFYKSILRFHKIEITNSQNPSSDFNNSITEPTTEPTTDNYIYTPADSDSKKQGSKKETPAKVKYAEFVFMTEEEYSKLVKDHGESMAKRCIEELDNYKGATGKTYKNDYRAILKWVIEAVKKKSTDTKPSSSNDFDFTGL